MGNNLQICWDIQKIMLRSLQINECQFTSEQGWSATLVQEEADPPRFSRNKVVDDADQEKIHHVRYNKYDPTKRTVRARQEIKLFLSGIRPLI